MTHVEHRTIRRITVGSAMLRVLLAVAVIVPMSVLFNQVWRSSSSGLDQVDQQRHGVDFLSALAPLTAALIKAQVGAKGDDLTVPTELFAAADEVAKADQRWGDELGTHQRWTDLREALEALRGKRFPDPATAFDSYQELSGRMVGIYARVRDESDLVLAPDQQIFHLAEAATVDIPRGVSAAGEYVGRLKVLDLNDKDVDLVAAVMAARERIERHGDALSESMEHALVASGSGALGKTLVGGLDQYRHSADLLVSSDDPETVSVATVAEAKVAGPAMIEAGLGLQTTVLAAMGDLLRQREGQLTNRQRLALAVVVPATVVFVVAVLVALIGRRGRRDASR